MRTWICAGLFLVVSCANPAGAATVAQTLQQFGFTGTFAARCDQPAAPDNIRRTVTIPERGDVTFVERFGDTYEPNLYEVLAARPQGRNVIVLDVRLGDTRQQLTIRKTRDRWRTMRNRAADGTVLVQNGIVAGSGRQTLTLSACKDE